MGYFKKELGQVFLRNKKISNYIANYLNIKNKNILEIGPGDGALTYALYNNNSKLLIIEKDKNFSKKIRNKFPNCTVINDDILNIEELFLNNHFKNIDYISFGNLPYNISSQIIWRFSHFTFCVKMIYMVQKEFGEKLISKKNFYSLYINNFWNIKKIIDVTKDNFYPVPKVDSIVLFFERRKDSNIIFENNNFIVFLKNCFKYKRKTLINNFFENKSIMSKIISRLNLSKKVRAEELNINTLIRIYNMYCDEFKE